MSTVFYGPRWAQNSPENKTNASDLHDGVEIHAGSCMSVHDFSGGQLKNLLLSANLPRRSLVCLFAPSTSGHECSIALLLFSSLARSGLGRNDWNREWRVRHLSLVRVPTHSFLLICQVQSRKAVHSFQLNTNILTTTQLCAGNTHFRFIYFGAARPFALAAATSFELKLHRND